DAVKWIKVPRLDPCSTSEVCLAHVFILSSNNCLMVNLLKELAQGPLAQFDPQWSCGNEQANGLGAAWKVFGPSGTRHSESHFVGPSLASQSKRPCTQDQRTWSHAELLSCRLEVRNELRVPFNIHLGVLEGNVR